MVVAAGQVSVSNKTGRELLTWRGISGFGVLRLAVSLLYALLSPPVVSSGWLWEPKVRSSQTSDEAFRFRTLQGLYSGVAAA